MEGHEESHYAIGKCDRATPGGRPSKRYRSATGEYDA